MLGALLVAAGGVVCAIVVAFTAAATLTTGFATGVWAWPPAPGILRLAVQVVTDPGHPAHGLADPWAHGVSGRELAFYAYTTAVVMVLASLTVGVSIPTWRRLAPHGPGHATRRQVRRTLTPAAARRTAAWTRPDLTPAQRRHAPITQISAPLPRGPHKEKLVVSLETPTGTIAPTRSGKSRTDLVHKALDAPGALFVSTTKDDLAEWCLLARSRRARGGVAWLLDMTGTVTWPRHVRWNPIAGCNDPAVALRRAETLIETSVLGMDEVGGNDKVFRGRARIVLQAYLLAAARYHRGIDDIITWALTKPADQEPADLLQRDYPHLAYNLRTETGMVAETADAVWMSVRRALEAFMNPDIRALCTPATEDPFDIDTVLDTGGSVFVIAGQHQAPQARPVLSAFAEEFLSRVQDRALRQEYRRNTPPVTTILDELYEGTPVPRLPGFISDIAGRGGPIHWSAQSRGQLDELYGEHGRKTLIDNTLTLSIFPGIKDDHTLEWLSTISGQHRRRTYQHHADGLLSTGRGSIGSEDTPTYRPGDIRTLDRNRVLLLHGNLKPILARTIDITHRPDWPCLDADVTTIRTGNAQAALDRITDPT
ncbi:type IV secretory system conjugative DNA transfer family protein [Amycolatopsis jejuensis]|uniref:type IV secretory system conjugative DNA transfer family protein n=1 Tax=Amycolatopsis jejuensis TaxID=330084 RepID=UPI000A01F3DB|nr:type IV secretory system conjugative DNA transfer family protein [Amycolatopsis jejuensis]